MSDSKQPFLWTYVQDVDFSYRTGAEEGLTESANEENTSAVSNFVTSGEERGSFESVNEEVDSAVVELLYNNKI